jgi:hypothetical protein
VGAIFAKSSQSSAQPDVPVASKPAPVETAVNVVPPPAGPLSKQVALAVVPQEAHVFDGAKDLGTSPVLLEVEEGKTLTLSLRMEGYKELELLVDGSKPRESVKLERLPTARVGARPIAAPKKASEVKLEPKPKKKPGIGGGEIVNPWD